MRRALVALLVGCVSAACGSDRAETGIDRDTFVETYAELRIAALDTDSARIAAAAREEILGRMGVTEEDLLGFVEAHGSDLEYMRDVWNDVELRLDRSDEER